MQFDVVVHVHLTDSRALERVFGLLDVLNQKVETMATKVSQLAPRLKAIDDHLTKVGTEVTGLKTDFETLKTQLSDVEIGDEAEATLTSIEGRVNTLDQLNDDAPEVPTDGGGETPPAEGSNG